MVGLVPAIHVLLAALPYPPGHAGRVGGGRRGCPRQPRAWRRWRRFDLDGSPGQARRWRRSKTQLYNV